MGYKQVPKRVKLQNGELAHVDYYAGGGFFGLKDRDDQPLGLRHTDYFTFLAHSPKTYVWDGRDE